MNQNTRNHLAARRRSDSYNSVDFPREILDAAAAIVDRLEGYLAETTYDRLLDQIARREGGLAHPAGTGDLINVIPGDQKAACTQVALAMATGTSVGRYGFPGIMRSVREYMIDCERITNLVVLLTDTWGPRQIEEHLRDVYAHARQGRYVVPHLVTGGRILRVDWPPLAGH